MKNFSLALLLSALTSLALPSVSHALVFQLALCTTADGRHQISVQDNMGTGPNRSSHIGAFITNGRGVQVGSYEVELYKGVHSPSFGRPHYQDVATKGKVFLLEAPSTNFRHFSVHARIKGAMLADDNLNCSVFNGNVLR
jgi:hypothetical protein